MTDQRYLVHYIGIIQPVVASRFIIENGALVFTDAEGGLAGYFDLDVVEKWYSESDPTSVHTPPSKTLSQLERMKIHLKSWKMRLSVSATAAVALMLLLALFYINPRWPMMSASELAAWKALAEQGDYETGGKLSLLYERGLGGVEKNFKEAYFLNCIAVVQVDSRGELAAVRRHASYDAKHLTAQEKAEIDQRVKEWVEAHPKLVVRPVELNSP